jgi:hypothetical protein
MKNSRKFLVASIYVLTLGSISLIFNNCGEGFDAAGKTESGSQGNPGPGPGPGPGGGATPGVNLVPVKTAVVAELGDVHEVAVNITSVAGYTGAVDLKVATPEIDEIELAKETDGVVISVTPTTVNVPKNGSVMAIVKINVGSQSPSLAEHFHLSAYSAGTLLLVNGAQAEVDLEIKPIFRMKVGGTGNGDANWRYGNSNKTIAQRILDGETKNFNFVSHAAGLQVLFENYKLELLRVHSETNNVIPHQPAGAQSAASVDGVIVGGTYTPALIMPDQIKSTIVYDHAREAQNANGRTLTFNADL